MKTQFSDPEHAKRIALLQQQAMHVCPPAAPFKKKKKKDSEDEDDAQHEKIEVPVGDDPDQTAEWKVPMFENGEPEEWIKWVLLPKLSVSNEGPFTVQTAHDNGTVVINENPAVRQTANTRRLTPCFDQGG